MEWLNFPIPTTQYQPSHYAGVLDEQQQHAQDLKKNVIDIDTSIGVSPPKNLK